MPFNRELGWQAYVPDEGRYDQIQYRRCGRSGLQLPAISLGLWQNFGDDRPLATSRSIIRRAFDLGITHFDLANNYGPPYGTAEINFGRIYEEDLKPYRDEIVISTKAGYDMWPGPYGEWGSRKYLLGSLEQSLKRMRLDYVDIFYSHRFDPDTPLEETMGALDTAVRQGKARYVGISSYGPAPDRGGRADPARARHAAVDPPALVLAAQPVGRGGAARRTRARGRRRDRVLAAGAGAADQPLPRRRSRGLTRADRELLQRGDALEREPRARARAERDRGAARADARADGDRLGAPRSAHHQRAARRASSVKQLEQNVAALERADFDSSELDEIDQYAGDGGINLWATSSSE